MFPFLTAIPLLWKLIAGAVFTAAIVAGYWFWHNAVYQRGYRAAVTTIIKLDEAAFERYREGQRQIDACRAQGKTWDDVKGECL